MAGKPRRIDPTAMGEKLKFPPRTGRAAGGGDSFWFNWPDYEKWHRVRFIGPWDDATKPWTGHCCHYRRVGTKPGAWPGLDGSGKNRAITCSEYHLEKPCPVCELIAYCETRGQEPMGISPKVQWLTNVIFEDDSRAKVWGSTPVSVIKKLKELYANPRFGEEIFDPLLGRDMEIIRHGHEGADWNEISYGVEHCDPSEIAVPDWESKVQTLSSFIKHYDRALVIRVLEAQMGDILPVRECFREELREMAAQPAAPPRSRRQVSTPSRRKAPAKKTKVVKKKLVGRQTKGRKKVMGSAATKKLAKKRVAKRRSR